MTSGSSTHSSIPRFDNDGETPISPGITLYSINTSSTRTFVNDDNVDEKDGLGDIDKPKYNSRSRAYFVKGAHKKSIRKAPWVTLPVRGTEDIWIEKDQEAVEWLSLFYDLVVVAVLTIFTTQHELSNPSAIPIFLSFFVIISWTWASQTAYDMRYQGNDALNRMFKFIQVGLFIYQGAASGNWNPARIEVFDDEDPYGARGTQHDDALQSFTTVVVAFAVSRAVLALQYVICLIQGRKVGRQLNHMYLNILALSASMILAIIAFSIPSTSQAWKIAKIVLFYSGIGLEVLNVFVASVLNFQFPIECHKVADRYGAFTLIILGEGIICLTRAFSRAISGLSNDDSGTYVQVFLSILIIYLLYSFLFGAFNKNDHTGHGRAIVWQILHFPLCFGILLLVAAMVNVVVTLSSVHGLTLTLDLLAPYRAAVFEDGPRYIDPLYLKHASKYMNKIMLEPPFAQAMTNLYGHLNETSNLDQPKIDPQVLYVQYAAQVAYEVFELYGAEVSLEATNMYFTIQTLNTTWIPDIRERAHVRDEAVHMYTEIVQEILNDLFTGVLWLLPVAGCVLVLAAFRSMLWYRFLGAAHWIYHGSQLIAGVCLGLLGFLDIGPKHLDISRLKVDGDLNVNPLYQILFNEIPLVIIAMVYLVVYMGSGLAIWFLQRRQDRSDGEGDGGGGERTRKHSF